MQNKRDKQKRDSTSLAGLGLCGILVIVFVIAISNLVTTTSSPVQGPVNNYWVPTDEDVLYQDSMYQIIKETETDMDTIHIGMARIIKKLDIIIYQDGPSDGIELYDTFNDVPAGCDSIIRVAGIVYKKNIDNWIALYTDEDVMWIGGNGDIIYE
jgi:hypothetical protein